MTKTVEAWPWPRLKPVLDPEPMPMGEDMTALLLAIARENADLRQQLALAQDMLMETAIDAGNLHALVDAMRT